MMGKISMNIPTFLKLSNPALFTSHCLRRSSATYLVNQGGDLVTLKRHEEWKSPAVAEAYVDASLKKKLKWPTCLVRTYLDVPVRRLHFSTGVKHTTIGGPSNSNFRQRVAGLGSNADSVFGTGINVPIQPTSNMVTGQESASEDISVAGGVNLILSPYFTNKEFSDITIVVGNEKFPAHKVILASKSECFKTWFTQNPDKKEMTISETNPQAFRHLLTYIYSGAITIPSENELLLQLLILARKYSLKELSSSIVNNLDNILDTKNVIFFLNVANDHDLEELRDACDLLPDDNVMEILSSDSFSSLSQESLIQILKRDTFAAPEIEIFKSVAKWCEINNNSDSLVLEYIRFSEMSASEVVSTVRSTNLVNSDKIVEIISEITGTSPKKWGPRASRILTVVDENVATVERGAQMVTHLETTGLQSGNTDLSGTVHPVVDGKNWVIVRLKQPHYLNHIRMRLCDPDERCSSYYIETSLDQRNWHRVIDYTRYACRSVQNLYFDQQAAKYIKIVGDDFHLVFYEAFYKAEIPKVIDGVIRQETNVATAENGVKVIQGWRYNDFLDEAELGTYHYVGDRESIILHLGQPYLISNLKFYLHCHLTNKYYIETSVNGTDWEILVDRRNIECTSWQYLTFAERVVVFIKLTGTCSNEIYRKFLCSSFECPWDGEKEEW